MTRDRVTHAAVREEKKTIPNDSGVPADATMCFGSCLAAFYRGEDSKLIAEDVVAVLWPGIAARN
jgi:hypothetical protein